MSAIADRDNVSCEVGPNHQAALKAGGKRRTRRLNRRHRHLAIHGRGQLLRIRCSSDDRLGQTAVSACHLTVLFSLTAFILEHLQPALQSIGPGIESRIFDIFGCRIRSEDFLLHIGQHTTQPLCRRADQCVHVLLERVFLGDKLGMGF